MHLQYLIISQGLIDVCIFGFTQFNIFFLLVGYFYLIGKEVKKIKFNPVVSDVCGLQ